MNLLRKITAIVDWIINAGAVLAAILVFYVTVAVLIEIFMRYFLGRATDWAIETSTYALLYITFLGTAWVLKKEAHVKMDIVTNELNPKPQAMLNSITYVVAAIACLILVWYSADITFSYYQTGFYYPSQMETPKFIVAIVVPFGSLLLFIQFLRNAQKYIQIWRTSR